MKARLLHLLYTKLFKPIFFRMDPEFVHERMTLVGKFLGRFRVTQWLTAAVFSYQDSILEQTIKGIRFKNPIGLSAGFDKNAELTQILPSVGFGFEEIGSITGDYCDGNPKPRLWRHPEIKSLRVYYGLKNDGAEELSNRLSKVTFRFPIGVSVAKTNNEVTADTDAGILDYIKAYVMMSEIGDYDTINVSCPNAFGGQPFTDPVKIEKLLTAICDVRNNKPMFIKLSPDLSTEELHALAEVAKKYKVDGLICSNLVKNHEFGKGGLSGKPVSSPSRKHLRYLHKNFGDDFVLVAVGGIFTAEDAYGAIKDGASLIQMITGMIYEGPQVIGEINKDLAEFVRKDGYKTISEAIGSNSKSD
ncbi:MAG: quinone-dependent dihydroorotate dehydrogenase [bacterium]|nr:quinone-dependent dihydroorotate dehydrogenase [bacterium]